MLNEMSDLFGDAIYTYTDDGEEKINLQTLKLAIKNINDVDWNCLLVDLIEMVGEKNFRWLSSPEGRFSQILIGDLWVDVVID